MPKVIDSSGNGCGAVGRAVSSDPRDPQLKHRDRQFYLQSTVIKSKTALKQLVDSLSPLEEVIIRVTLYCIILKLVVIKE